MRYGKTGVLNKCLINPNISVGDLLSFWESLNSGESEVSFEINRVYSPGREETLEISYQ